ncbi:MAG: hypothetical protein WEA56_02300 [Balneolaceae bacterium]
MKSKRSHSVHILETPYSTVTSGGHWFHATRDKIEEFVPGLMKKYSFEDLVTKAVAWIDSSDSLAMILYFVLAYTTNAWTAAGIALLFHGGWYFNKSAFVNTIFTPVIRLFNSDAFQLLLAAVALSFMGINGMYTALVIGIIYFFLFKIGLLRRLWDKADARRNGNRLPLNDRVLKMILVRYSIYENMPPVEVERLDRHVRQAVLEFNKKKK